SFDGAQIRLCERVISVDRRVARALFVERAERSGGLYVSDGFGIDESGLETQRLSGTNLFHAEIADVELEGRLARLVGVDKEFRVSKYEMVEANFPGSDALPKIRHLFSVPLGRDIHSQPAYVNRVDIHGLAEEIAQGGLEAKF